MRMYGESFMERSLVVNRWRLTTFCS